MNEKIQYLKQVDEESGIVEKYPKPQYYIVKENY